MSDRIRDLESADAPRADQIRHLREENNILQDDLRRALESHALAQRRGQAAEERAAALEERLAAAEAGRARSRVLEHTEELERLLECALAADAASAAPAAGALPQALNFHGGARPPLN